MTAQERPPGDGHRPEDLIRTDVPHSARIYNYWLGGKDHFDIDRVIGEQVVQAEPEMVAMMRHNRTFLGRAVDHLVRERGIRQFLDIGTGLPVADNTHEVAQRAAPESRIVYVDNDPIVLVHARALLTSSPEGATDYIDADLRDPRTILSAAAKTLDFGEPVAVMLLGVLNHIAEDAQALAIVRTLMDALVPGSHLVISVNTNVLNPENMNRAAAAYNEAFGNPPIYLSTPERLAAFFEGMEMVDPGLVPAARWKPIAADSPFEDETSDMDLYVGVGRKP
ncbi:SAM-dependent methyltransferase [Nonomuraea sp. K274]|uniref:SAM-dependent methyltransferase n=1 Tax=Nonomuraea cypriaca TaxID=1187855 RepID=A0A931AGK4_9ACTN|nr:SAM-dependent methyltransferase [Nonomuraea cypriaca]MBF8191250.1 SAM-dependent methyltransferase [Nonomuraea cypriaca]